MTNPIEQIIKSYNPKTTNETKAILREIIQSLVLIELSRSNFFLRQVFMVEQH